MTVSPSEICPHPSIITNHQKSSNWLFFHYSNEMNSFKWIPLSPFNRISTTWIELNSSSLTRETTQLGCGPGRARHLAAPVATTHWRWNTQSVSRVRLSLIELAYIQHDNWCSTINNYFKFKLNWFKSFEFEL